MMVKLQFKAIVVLAQLLWLCMDGIQSQEKEKPCILREEKFGLVCVCNATYCDFLDNPVPASENDFVLITTSKAGLRFNVFNGSIGMQEILTILDYNALHQANSTPIRNVSLAIDRNKKQQKIEGFGGAFTGTVSYLLNLLPQQLQDHVYNSYYSPAGIGYNLLRTPIGGCDFDLEPWAYNELPENDPQLSNFTELHPRDQRKVEQIQRLKSITGVQQLQIKGAAWSAPRWMKTNNAWAGSSRLKHEYYQTWADYYIKWLELMEKHALPVWAISTGNEPMNGVALWYFANFMSLGWTPKNQSTWLADHLGPTVRKSKFKDLIIFGNDDQRYTYPYWFNAMNSSRPDSIDFLNGLSMHWYFDEVVPRGNVKSAHRAMPDKLLINSEACIGSMFWEKDTPSLGDWQRGEKYARSLLRDLQDDFNGWIDWNLILDENGGPNYVNNTVDAPIIVKQNNPTEILKQPIFYAIGHFSKFIPKGSIRIESKRSNVNIDTIAFLRPDGLISTIIFNSGRAHVNIKVTDSIRGSFVVKIPPQSIHTLIYK